MDQLPGTAADARLNVVLCWHMHQPEYRDLLSGDYQLPWTYLHAIKDYADMAAHLEAVPAARAVVNFVPALLEQIEDYAAQVHGCWADGVAVRDPVLGALGRAALPVDQNVRVSLIRACLRTNEQRLVHRFPAFHRLARMANWLIEHVDVMAYVNDQFLADMLVWYHLAWLGETVRRRDTRVKRLIDKGANFTWHDRRELLTVIDELLADLIPRYRRLAENGQVELSVTPYAHPILPLLIDFGVAREAMPDVKLPPLERYPGGEERARWHIRRGIESFERYFGVRPTGCWPSEGGISTAAARLLGEAGFSWFASGEGVLRHSLAASGHAAHSLKEAWLYRPYRLTDAPIAGFYRDDGLSDLIGFTYSTWHADDAVGDLVTHLEHIAECCKHHPDRVVSIIMDGENAWEHYPENAFYFLSALYRRLGEHPRLKLTTFSEYLKAQPAPRALPKLIAGSWVYGTFSTWIGEPDKNRGWEMLGDAKRAFDAAAGRLDAATRTAAECQLAVCEGSDWFWWLGDYNPAATVSDFERLFRLHLGNLYQILGVEAPEYVSHVFAHGRGTPAHGGVMRPGQAVG